MAYTTTDLSSIESAIIDLATGARKVRVSIGDKMIEYGQIDIDKLQALKSVIERSLGTVPGRTYARQAGRSTT